MLLEGFIAVSVLVFVWMLSKKDPEPLLGVYAEPGKWFLLKKYVSMLCLLIRKHLAKRITFSHGDQPGYGQSSRRSIDEMECPQQLSDDDMAIDCMYFNGLDSAGTFVVLRIARRNGRKAELWLSINVPGVGFFQSPIHPDTNLYNVDSNVGDKYSAGGLKFECVEPMKRWRVTFNGLLRKGMSSEWSPEKFETVHVQMSLVWCAFTDVFDFDTDIHPHCLSESLAKEKWSRDFFDRLKKSHQTHYEQWGEMWGTVSVEGHPEKIISVRGYRDHSYGVRDWQSFHRYAITFAYLEDGSVFHVNSVSMPDTMSLLKCGYMSMPNAIMHPVSWTDMDLLDLGENRNPPKNYEFNFVAGDKAYHVRVTSQTEFLYYLHEDWRTVVFEQVSTFEVNGIKGYGIFEFAYRYPQNSPVKPERVLPMLRELSLSEVQDINDALALTFTEPGCTSSVLVGGKGCQLALLTQLRSKKFSVPVGFCLTIRAFETQLKTDENLQRLVSELHDISCTNSDKLQSFCTEVVKAFQSSLLCDEVRNAVVQHLEKVFGADYSSVSLAVRSSATGEDGAEMSAAGQMETYLGVHGQEQIFKAISKCWASQFAFPAVSYRRQHGQPIKLSAGVVIQQMVPAMAAGVLFTCHPVTGNPGQMVINANFGLGESVVSGESQPDEITICRGWDDKLELLSKTVGTKKVQIKLTASGDTEEIIGDEGDTSRCCLSDEVLLKLADIGVELEKRFCNPRDIEFAVDSDGVIQLLQARPITSLDHVSEYDLMHEFDSALAHDREFLTTANIQEMMPEAMTTLTLDLFLAGVELSSQKNYMEALFHPCLHRADKFVVSCCNQGFLNLLMNSGGTELHCSIGNLNTLFLAVLGEIPNGITLEDVRSYHGSFPLWKRLFSAYKFCDRIRHANSRTQHWLDSVENDIINSAHVSSSEIYDVLTQKLKLISEGEDWTICQDSSGYDAATSVYQGCVSYLCKRGSLVIAKLKCDRYRPEWKPDHFSDLALLMGQCKDVYSADVPSALNKLSSILVDTGCKETFISLSPDDAVRWLQSTESGRAGVVFKEFLVRHGHRCIREAELREKSWRREPAKLVKILQTLVRNSRVTAARDIVPIGDLINRIKTPTTAVERAILRWLLPKAHKAVGGRELSKSLLIKTIDNFKEAYEKLANMMVNESRLPDKDLIYFFSHRELGRLIESRSGSLVSRAQKRRQLLPKQMKLRFPKTIFGRPIAIGDSADSDSDTSHLTSALKLTGCPVSQGVICGTARVVTSIEEASEIQNDDILIVPYTDVGWSPYFPMISGLVTEMGGLLSHGAVVAREYGLPCVVNAQRATVLFKSGNDVIVVSPLGGVLKYFQSCILQGRQGSLEWHSRYAREADHCDRFRVIGVREPALDDRALSTFLKKILRFIGV